MGGVRTVPLGERSSGTALRQGPTGHPLLRLRLVESGERRVMKSRVRPASVPCLGCGGRLLHGHPPAGARFQRAGHQSGRAHPGTAGAAASGNSRKAGPAQTATLEPRKRINQDSVEDSFSTRRLQVAF